MKWIRKGYLEIIASEESPGDDWAELTVPLVFNERQELDMIPFADPPYLRAKTQSEKDAEAAAAQSVEDEETDWRNQLQTALDWTQEIIDTDAANLAQVNIALTRLATIQNRELKLIKRRFG